MKFYEQNFDDNQFTAVFNLLKKYHKEKFERHNFEELVLAICQIHQFFLVKLLLYTVFVVYGHQVSHYKQ